MKQPTQNDRVLNHLVLEGKIDDTIARDMYGIRRLGARIFDLRKMGYKIESETKHVTNRYGRRVTYSEYYLKEVAI